MVVGVFVVIAVIAFFWMIFKFGDLPMIVSEIKSFEIRVQFPSAPGVQRDTPVRFCGYQIGRVTKVLPPDNLRDLETGQYYFQAVVIASIDNQYYGKISAAVEAKLVTRGLGSSYIELRVPQRDIREGEFLVEGSLLQGSTGMASEFFPEESQKKLDEMITGITAFVNSSNEIVGDAENKANLKTTLANLAKASQEATEAIKDIRELSVAGKATLQNTDARMERLSVSLVETSDKLGEVLSHLEGVVDKINNGEGTAGKLLNDGRLYEQLLEDSRQMELLLKDMRSFMVESNKKGYLPIKWK
jgi:phospholipid/cholesterol/gamma-HCH transport system substrate-binding protein